MASYLANIGSGNNVLHIGWTNADLLSVVKEKNVPQGTNSNFSEICNKIPNKMHLEMLFA